MYEEMMNEYFAEEDNIYGDDDQNMLMYKIEYESAPETKYTYIETNDVIMED